MEAFNPIGEKPWSDADHRKARAALKKEHRLTSTPKFASCSCGARYFGKHDDVWFRDHLETMAQQKEAPPREGTAPASSDHAPLLRAIRARLYGEWDHPDLVKMGHLFTDSDQDIIAWIDAALGEEKKPKPAFAAFCSVCQKTLGGTSPEGRKGYVLDGTMHVVGVETPKQVIALCGHRYAGKVHVVEQVTFENFDRKGA